MSEKRAPRQGVPLAGVFLLGVLFVAVAIALYRERKPPLELVTALATIEARLEAKHQAKGLARLRAACRTHDCDCAAKASSAGLGVEAIAAVHALGKAATRCPSRETFDGIRAETLMRTGDVAGAMKASVAVLAKAPKEAHALYVQALFGYQAGQLDAARELAESSRQAGRGSPAVFLAGLIAFASNDLEGARHAFREVLASEPEDVDSLYNLAVVAQRQQRYGEARSLYLRVTRLSPSHENARYHLAILAHSVGATDEARHHLEKLRALRAPAERIKRLEEELRRPPATPPSQVLVLGASSAAVSP